MFVIFLGANGIVICCIFTFNRRIYALYKNWLTKRNLGKTFSQSIRSWRRNRKISSQSTLTYTTSVYYWKCALFNFMCVTNGIILLLHFTVVDHGTTLQENLVAKSKWVISPKNCSFSWKIIVNKNVNSIRSKMLLRKRQHFCRALVIYISYERHYSNICIVWS